MEPERDDFEIALVAEARARNLPIFAICRGVQVLNVACGGTLVQDIPSEVTGALAHSFGIPPHEPYSLAHEVWIDKDTLLWTLMRERLSDADACEVNSRHHQAVKRLAGGFRDGDGARRDRRSDRRSRRALLPRRAVASGEFLPDRRVPSAVRRVHRGRGVRDSTGVNFCTRLPRFSVT